ncbi:uncharacterized protein [Prorops nasuta]|uniref:uncharacterized protein isoform X2 n=1 Tax=Prorops nasuta TaxID=863751 RepID=UPI0034CFA1E7
MFYIYPPSGKISLHHMENSVFTRLDYLEHLYSDRVKYFHGNFEFLLENTLHDRVGHFTLRLLAALSSDLWTYWSVREVLLFKHRLAKISSKLLYKLLRSFSQQIKPFNSESLIQLTLYQISILYLKPHIFKHLSYNHSEECKLYSCKVRFELLPNLIKSRKVTINAGYAIIYCSQWKLLLESLFFTYLRIQKNIFKSETKYGIITAVNINTESNHFPPCMKHLHTVLRNKHRLSHYARFTLSLFLKDCGMELNDAIIYWKEEYSKEHNCNSVCLHNWNASEKKFIYSIRHLYGLEGSKKDYAAPDCSIICKTMPGPKYEGGCPFQHFDEIHLKHLLSSSLKERKLMNFIKTIHRRKPNEACAEYLKLITKRTQILFISNPVQFYHMLNKT